MIFQLFDGFGDRYGDIRYIVVGVICMAALFVFFYLHNLFSVGFCRLFRNRCEKGAASPRSVFCLSNTASALLFFLFGCCWKEQQVIPSRKKAATVFVSVFTLICCAVVSVLFLLAGAFLNLFSEKSFFAFAVLPFVIFFRALFMIGVCIVIFSFIPLPRFMLGNIICALLPVSVAEKFEKAAPYSFFFVMIIAVFAGRGGMIESLYSIAGTWSADLLSLII